MGKKIGSSWLTLVKRAFSRKRNEYEQDEEEKKREKRRWLFRKGNDDVQQCEATVATNISTTTSVTPIIAAKQRHASVVAAAEAAVATAQAAVEILRLTRPSCYAREHYAAIIIQTAFRGHLARRALRALKGIVKLQALVRGQNVRNQAKLTLRCIQALVRTQDKVRRHRGRLSHEGSRRFMFAETNNLWESTNLHDVKNRKSTSYCNVSHTLDDWEEFQDRKEAAMKRDKSLAYTLSDQIWRSRRNPSVGDGKELKERTKWLDRWMVTKQWENDTTRVLTDKREHIKNVEIDMSRPTTQKFQHQNHHQKLHRQLSITTPPYRALQNLSFQHSRAATATPTPCKTKPIQVRSASPRCLKEERSYSTAQTPNLNGVATSTSTTPNYMAATESAKARARSQSAPRQRPSTPVKERSGSAKKRLSYPVPEPHSVVVNACTSCNCSQNSRSTSFKSVLGAYSGIEQMSNYSSCFTESYGGEISPWPSGSRFSLNLWE